MNKQENLHGSPMWKEIRSLGKIASVVGVLALPATVSALEWYEQPTERYQSIAAREGVSFYPSNGVSSSWEWNGLKSTQYLMEDDGIKFNQSMLILDPLKNRDIATNPISNRGRFVSQSATGSGSISRSSVRNFESGRFIYFGVDAGSFIKDENFVNGGDRKKYLPVEWEYVDNRKFVLTHGAQTEPRENLAGYAFKNSGSGMPFVLAVHNGQNFSDTRLIRPLPWNSSYLLEQTNTICLPFGKQITDIPYLPLNSTVSTWEITHQPGLSVYDPVFSEHNYVVELKGAVREVEFTTNTTQFGFVVGTTSSPTLNLMQKKIVGGTTLTKEIPFSTKFTDRYPGETFYYRTYAICENGKDTVYSKNVTKVVMPEMENQIPSLAYGTYRIRYEGGTSTSGNGTELEQHTTTSWMTGAGKPRPADDHSTDWMVLPVAGNPTACTIMHLATGNYLTYHWADHAGGAGWETLEAKSDGVNQQWKIYTARDGSTRIRSNYNPSDFLIRTGAVGNTYEIDMWSENDPAVITNNLASWKFASVPLYSESKIDGIKLRWNFAPTSIDTVKLYRFDPSGKDSTEVLKTSDKTVRTFTDTYQDLIPGFAYTYKVYGIVANGATQSQSTTGYKFANGQISGYVTAPAGANGTGAGIPGVAVSLSLLSDIPNGNKTPLKVYTDGSGFYRFKNVYYYTDGDFRLVPSFTDANGKVHEYSPVSKTINLTRASSDKSDNNFTDLTSYSAGFKVLQNYTNSFGTKYTLGIKNVEVLRNGTPMGFTSDAAGDAKVSLSQSGTYTFTPQLKNHKFKPESLTEQISTDISGRVFEDTTKYVLKGTFVGPCGSDIGDIRLLIRGGIFDTTTDEKTQKKTVTLKTEQIVDTIWTEKGVFSVKLPARDYLVTAIDVKGNNGNYIFGSATNIDSVAVRTLVKTQIGQINVSLQDSSNTIAMTYRKDPALVVKGFKDFGVNDRKNVAILTMFKPETLSLSLKEDLDNTDTCLVSDSMKYIIRHSLGGSAVADTVIARNGKATYILKPMGVNLIAPHQFTIEIEAQVGTKKMLKSSQVFVNGFRPQNNTFATVSPEIPLIILRDPPGDGSYATLSKGSSVTKSWSVSALTSSEANMWLEGKIGAEFAAGFGITTEFKAWVAVKMGLTVGASVQSQNDFSTTITTTEDFKTSSELIGEEGDLYVGGALNLITASCDTVFYDKNNDKVNTGKSFVVCPNGFATNYVYTQNSIETSLLPKLNRMKTYYADKYKQTNTVSYNDSAKTFSDQYDAWQNILNQNSEQKKKAAFAENVSFSGGAEKSSSVTTDGNESYSVTFNAFVSPEIAMNAGLEAAGSGFSLGSSVKMRIEMGGSVGGSTTTSRTVGYTLTDKDPQDVYTVDICKDPVYQTPVFKLKAAETSCPYIPGTLALDDMAIRCDSTVQYLNNLTDTAVFNVTLGNNNPNKEKKTYNLIFLQESNPDGAIVTLNGSPVVGNLPIPYTLEAGANGGAKAQIAIRRGAGKAQVYNNLRFRFQSQCDESKYDSLSLSVNYTDMASSDIAIETPVDGWVFSSAKKSLSLKLARYNEKVLKSVVIQYSELGKNIWNDLTILDTNWVKAAIADPAKNRIDLILNALKDGQYEFRACAISMNNSIRYSRSVKGLIDCVKPELFGYAEPIDRELNSGDLIAANYTENLNPYKIGVKNVQLEEVSSASNGNKVYTPIKATIGCVNNRIVIVPDGEMKQYTGKTIRATLGGIEDLNGNIADSVRWVFTVADTTAGVLDPKGDFDRDGILNNVDNCPIAFNTDQKNIDKDAAGDVCDDDIDGDNVSNYLDNCAFIPNTNQEDTDADGIGDACSESVAYLHYSAGENGSLATSEGRSRALGKPKNAFTFTINRGTGTPEPIVAVPATGSKFLMWSDGVTTAERIDSKVLTDISVTALFEKVTAISEGTKVTPAILPEGRIAAVPNPSIIGGEGLDIFVNVGTESYDVTVYIYDLLGNLIDQQEASQKISGTYHYRWNLENRQGLTVGSGTYLAVAKVTNMNGKSYLLKTSIGVKK